jgi:hypothetical protein
VYHELGHFIYWTDAERKADTFAYRMVRGLSLGRENAARTLRVVSESLNTRRRVCRTATKKRQQRAGGGSVRESEQAKPEERRAAAQFFRVSGVRQKAKREHLTNLN